MKKTRPHENTARVYQITTKEHAQKQAKHQNCTTPNLPSWTSHPALDCRDLLPLSFSFCRVFVTTTQLRTCRTCVFRREDRA